MIKSITGNWWGGGSVAPEDPTIYRIGAVSDTTIRITPGFAGRAEFYQVWRATTELGVYTLIGTISPQNTFFDDSSLSASTLRWYKLRAGAGTGSGIVYSGYSAPRSATTLSTTGIERNLWSGLTNYLRNDVALAGYIQLFKFDKEERIIMDSEYPALKGWVASTEELWVGIPKQKIVKMNFILHGLVQNRETETLELEKLLMDEKIKNALERAGMDLDGIDTINLVGNSTFQNLDSYRAETFVEAELWSIRFTAGNR
jgi:hypothetical protein